MQGKRIAPEEPSRRQRPETSPAGAGREQKQFFTNAPQKDRPAVPPTKERTQQREKRHRRAYRIAISVLAVILAILIAFTAWWKLVFTQKPEVTPPSEPTSEGEVTDIGPPVRDSGERKEDFYTFLVIGRDTGGGGNTDTILLASYDIQNQKLSVMSIPRDTMVNVSWDVKKINSVYNVYGGGDRGIEALDKEISQLVGFVPDFQVILEWEAVGELVDALGGVYFDVPRNMSYRDPTQNLVISLKKGPQSLDGNKAMQLVRYRSYVNGDLGRVQVQQDFLKAVIHQCLQIGNVTRITELSKVFNENVTTNLNVGNIAWFGEKAVFGGLKEDSVQFFTLPCQGASVYSRSFGNYQSYVVPKTQELVDLVNTHFNPYIEDLRSNELDIMYVNSNGTIGSSTGQVEDAKANNYARPVKIHEEPKAPVEEPSSETNTPSTPSTGDNSGQIPGGTNTGGTDTGGVDTGETPSSGTDTGGTTTPGGEPVTPTPPTETPTTPEQPTPEQPTTGQEEAAA